MLSKLQLFFLILQFFFILTKPIPITIKAKIFDDTDPNHINAVFRFMDERPDLVTHISITEKQIKRETPEGCLQYDYVLFRWVSNPRWNPFPNLTDGVPRCTELRCDNIFGPANSVNCEKWFK